MNETANKEEVISKETIVNVREKFRIAKGSKTTFIATAGVFNCRCGKTKFGVHIGQETNTPCPECARLYKGIFNKEKSVIVPKQIKRFSRYFRLYKIKRHFAEV